MVEENHHKPSSNKTAHVLKKFLVANSAVLDKMESKVDSYEQQLKILKEENKKLKDGKSYDAVFDETLVLLIEDSMKKVVRLDSKLS